jgi:hypothetical protein
VRNEVLANDSFDIRWGGERQRYSFCTIEGTNGVQSNIECPWYRVQRRSSSILTLHKLANLDKQHWLVDGALRCGMTRGA